MLSKSGVYKSFLKIAEVARQRGNKEIEEQFLKYAEEYKENNELFDDEPVVVEDTVAVGLAVDEPLQEEIKIAVPVAETENRVEEELQIETQPDCNTLIISGIELLMKGEREAAADIFRQARQIEGCEAVSIEDILKIIGR